MNCAESKIHYLVGVCTESQMNSTKKQKIISSISFCCLLIPQHSNGYAAYGPILQGLNAPINDLSRGCNADEVYKMSLITACQS